jgi:hypothetical protein
MKKLPWIAYAAIDAVGVLIYVSGVVWLMVRAQDIFGAKMNEFWGPLAMLLLFVLSAAVVGSLVFGRPLFLALKQKTHEAILLAVTTIGFLFGLTLIVFGLLAAKVL